MIMTMFVGLDLTARADARVCDAPLIASGLLQ